MEKTAVQPPSYRPGDMGPAGGIVFYDRGFTGEDGWRYLEAAPAGTEVTALWGPDTKITGTEVKVGSGRRNTQLIVAALGGDGKAAQLCNDLNINGYNDWFLPSKDELDVIHNALRQRGLGGFLSGEYWSSSQNAFYGNRAWSLHFRGGSRSNCTDKSNTYLVRAIRAF